MLRSALLAGAGASVAIELLSPVRIFTPFGFAAVCPASARVLRCCVPVRVCACALARFRSLFLGSAAVGGSA